MSYGSNAGEEKDEAPDCKCVSICVCVCRLSRQQRSRQHITQGKEELFIYASSHELLCRAVCSTAAAAGINV